MNKLSKCFQWFFSDPADSSISTTTVRRLVCGIWAVFFLLCVIVTPFSQFEFFQDNGLFTQETIFHYLGRIISAIYLPVFVAFGIFWFQWKGNENVNIDTRVNSKLAYAIVGLTLLCNVVIFCIILGLLFGTYENSTAPQWPKEEPEIAFDRWILFVIQSMVLVTTLPLARLLGVKPPPGTSKKQSKPKTHK